MHTLLDKLRFVRREKPRIAIQCVVDAQVPGTEDYVGFYTRDVSVSGVSLQGIAAPAVERVCCTGRHVVMALRFPTPQSKIDVEARLQWEREEHGQAITGWAFTRISRSERNAIETFIRNNPDVVIDSPV